MSSLQIQVLVVTMGIQTVLHSCPPPGRAVLGAAVLGLGGGGAGGGAGGRRELLVEGGVGAGAPPPRLGRRREVGGHLGIVYIVDMETESLCNFAKVC